MLKDYIKSFVPMFAAVAVMCLISPLPVHNYFILLAVAMLLKLIRRERLAKALGVGFFAAFIVLTVLSAYRNNELTSDYPSGPYNELMMQMKKGHLYMPGVPDPRIVASKDPYDASQRNGGQIIWDQSYYKGHYYLYWGAAPIVTLDAPFYLLTGKYLTEVGQGLWFSLLAILFCYLVTVELIRTYTGKLPGVVESLMIAGTLVLCCEFGASLRRIAIYEIPIYACTAYLFAGVYLLLIRERFKHALWMAGVSFGLAIASRPTSIFGYLLIPFLIQDRKSYVSFFKGLVPIGLLLAFYNIARFDNPFEFGHVYQMEHIDLRKWGPTKVNLIYGICAFLFQPLLPIPTFPFVQIAVFGENWLTLRHSYMSESVLGLLPLCPFLLLALPSVHRRKEMPERRLLLAFVVAGFCTLFINATAGVSRRYSTEFFPLFVAAGLTSIFITSHFKQSRSWNAIVFAVLIYSMNTGFFGSISVGYSRFETDHPEAYQRLAAFYSNRPYVYRSVVTQSLPVPSMQNPDWVINWIKYRPVQACFAPPRVRNY